MSSVGLLLARRHAALISSIATDAQRGATVASMRRAAGASRRRASLSVVEVAQARCTPLRAVSPARCSDRTKSAGEAPATVPCGRSGVQAAADGGFVLLASALSKTAQRAPRVQATLFTAAPATRCPDAKCSAACTARAASPPRRDEHQQHTRSLASPPAGRSVGARPVQQCERAGKNWRGDECGEAEFFHDPSSCRPIESR